MTLLSTKYNQAENWSSRLPVARDIWREVRAESSQESPAPIQTVDADSLSFDELERLTDPSSKQGSNSRANARQ
jgi:hypothetical protein